MAKVASLEMSMQEHENVNPSGWKGLAAIVAGAAQRLPANTNSRR